MLEQRDQRGKRFAIRFDTVVGDAGCGCCRRAEALEEQAQRDRRELERAQAVAGPDGSPPHAEVLEQ